MEEQQNPNDLVRTCQDCTRKFIITESEQKYMSQHGYALPKRCLTCRKIRRRNEVRRREQREKKYAQQQQGHLETDTRQED